MNNTLAWWLWLVVVMSNILAPIAAATIAIRVMKRRHRLADSIHNAFLDSHDEQMVAGQFKFIPNDALGAAPYLCPHCKKPNYAVAARYCKYCGVLLICPNCELRNDPDAKYCNRCREKLLPKLLSQTTNAT